MTKRNTERDCAQNPVRSPHPWEHTRSHRGRASTKTTRERLRDRITCVYEDFEKRAIDGLSRTHPDRVPDEWKELANQPARNIAKALDLERLSELVEWWYSREAIG